MDIKNKFNLLSGILIVALLFNGCDKEEAKKDNTDDTTGELTLNLLGLSNLGKDYEYEGWLLVDGKAITAGRFDVDNSNFSKKFTDVKAADLTKATAYILTIEPEPDSDPKPTNIHILAGDFSDKKASLSIEHKSALGKDFATAKGTYILSTPSDGVDRREGTDTNPTSGVWWLVPPDPTSGLFTKSLTLPTLPSGWKYEGWAVINNTPVSTGTFSRADAADDKISHYDFPTQTMTIAVPFPGEDFLKNAPDGLTFPTDLSKQKIVISIEPDPDNSAAPFSFKPLVGDVPDNATTGTSYDMKNNVAASKPTGTASRP